MLTLTTNTFELHMRSHFLLVYLRSLFQGLEIVFRVGMAILQMNQADLIQLDMEGMLQVYHDIICITRHLHYRSILQFALGIHKTS